MKTQQDKQSVQKHAIRNFVEKIVVNAGIGRASQQPNFEEKVLPQIVRDVSMVAGQKPKVTRAKKSVAGFKIREGQTVGVQATLRGRAAVDFFERLTTMVLPRVRDFTGVDQQNVDREGALNLGFKEQLTFPEINPEESTFSFSLGVNIVPKKRNRPAALEHYRTLGVPFKSAQSK